MREILKSGSVRGVRSNPHPYRDLIVWGINEERTAWATRQVVTPGDGFAAA